MATPRVLSPQPVAQQDDGQYPERMSWAERLEEAEAASRLRMEQRQMKKRLKDPTEREGLPLGIFGIGSEEEVVENDDESSLFEWRKSKDSARTGRSGRSRSELQY